MLNKGTTVVYTQPETTSRILVVVTSDIFIGGMTNEELVWVAPVWLTGGMNAIPEILVKPAWLRAPFKGEAITIMKRQIAQIEGHPSNKF